MAKYLKLFTSHLSYLLDNNAELPNISYCKNENEVHYNDLPDAIITFTGTNATLDITSTKQGRPLEALVLIPNNYYTDNASVIMNNLDITSTAWDPNLEKITIDNVDGDLNISISASPIATGQQYFEPVYAMLGSGFGFKHHYNITDASKIQSMTLHLTFPEYVIPPSESTLSCGVTGSLIEVIYYGANCNYSSISMNLYYSSGDTLSGILPLLLSLNAPIGKYLNAILLSNGQISENPGGTSSTTLGDTLINIIPYERKLLSITDTEFPTDEYNLSTRDVNINKTINANEWTFISFPFSLTESQLKNAFGNDVLIAQYFGDDYNNDNDIILDFESVDISSGVSGRKPYIIKTSSTLSFINIDSVVIYANDEYNVIEYDNGRPKDNARYQLFSANHGYLKKQKIRCTSNSNANSIILTNKQFSIITDPNFDIDAYNCSIEFDLTNCDFTSDEITGVYLRIDDNIIEGYSLNSN